MLYCQGIEQRKPKTLMRQRANGTIVAKLLFLIFAFPNDITELVLFCSFITI